MRLKLVTLLLAASGISGCAVGPDFVAPKPDVPADWSAASAQTGADAGAAGAGDLSRWWEAFNDPELTSLIVRARDSNPTLKQASLRISEARAQLDAVGARELPTASLDSSYARTGLSPNGALSLFGSGAAPGASAAASAIPSTALKGFTIPPFDLFQTGFDASWELDIFGGVRRGIESAEAQAQALADERNDTQLSVFAEVARDYVQLRGVQRLIAITEDNLRAQRDSFNLTHAQAQGGETSDLDVQSASAEVATTEAELPSLHDQERHAMNALSLLLNQQPGSLEQELAAAKPLPVTPPGIPIGLPSELARRRPDIRRAESDLHAATANIGVATADLYPKLSLSGSLGLQAIRFQKLGDWASRFYNAGPSLSIPVFNGTTYANIAIQETRQKEAALTYETTVLGALHDVENAVSSYSAQKIRLKAYERAATANAKALSLAQQRYRAGLSSFLDVLDSERRLYASQTQVAQSAVAIDTDVIALYKALGGGWESASGPDVAQPDRAPQGTVQPVLAK